MHDGVCQPSLFSSAGMASRDRLCDEFTFFLFSSASKGAMRPWTQTRTACDRPVRMYPRFCFVIRSSCEPEERAHACVPIPGIRQRTGDLFTFKIRCNPTPRIFSARLFWGVSCRGYSMYPIFVSDTCVRERQSATPVSTATDIPPAVQGEHSASTCVLGVRQL